jgi:hypothetical protein
MSPTMPTNRRQLFRIAPDEKIAAVLRSLKSDLKAKIDNHGHRQMGYRSVNVLATVVGAPL